MRSCIIAFLVLNMLVSCGKKEEKEQAQQPVAIKKNKIVKVVTKRVQKVSVTETKKAYGYAVPFKSVDVFSKVNGVVLKKFRELGETVNAGDVLAVVRQDIPGMEFADHEVKANLSGTIFKDFTEEGATVTVQKPLFNLARLDPILAEIKIPEEWLTRINFEQPINVNLEAFPTQTFQARLYRLLPQNDSKSRSAIARLKISNPNLKIKAGMFVTAEFKFSRHDALVIPVDALVRSGLEYYVFKVQNNVVHKQLVQPGEIFGRNQEILNGLQANESVVVFGQNLLEDGVQVEVEEVQ